jgi:cyclopropane fatty-acyl-phospholipid synthase-like methyltransferase
MILDTFERYKHNLYLSPITSGTLENIGKVCGLTESSIVLDIACGKGGAALTLAEKFKCTVTGIESRAEFAEEVHRRAVFEDLDHFVNVIDSGPQDLPFDDFYFDLALSLGHVRPFNTLKMLLELSRVVRDGGWIALSEMVWKSGNSGSATPAVREWVSGFTSGRVMGLDERVEELSGAGFQVESAELEADKSWEDFYTPQAQAILENRHEFTGSSEAQSKLDQWQNELELYHTAGGKESLGYACFILRLP